MEKKEGVIMNSKEFQANGVTLQCYPLTAAQRLHNYTLKFCPYHRF